MIHQNDPTPSCIHSASGAEAAGGLVDFDPVQGHLLGEHRSRGRVLLVSRQNPGVGRFPAEALDDVLARLKPIELDILPILGGQVEDRHRSTQHVANRVAQAPPSPLPWARVEGIRSQVSPVRRKVVHSIEVRGCKTVESRLSQERDRVSEVVNVVDNPRVPIIESLSSMNRARHSPLVQIGRHICAQQIDPTPHEGVSVAGNRFGKRRDPDPGRKRRRLMVVVEDLRAVFQRGSRYDLRLEHVVHIAVTVVVVADIFWIEPRQSADFEWSP